VNGRLNGLLGVSRAFGDIAFKRDWKQIGEYLVSIDPFLAYYELTPNDKFIILGRLRLISFRFSSVSLVLVFLRSGFGFGFFFVLCYSFIPILTCLGCDGLWDVMSYQYAVDFAAFRLDRGELPEAVAEALVDKALNELKSQDNVSCIIVSFKWSKTSSHFQPVVSPASATGLVSANSLNTTLSQST
jgi:serine/threonine protein phosphatase PrpC